jgi:hypothetical protein
MAFTLKAGDSVTLQNGEKTEVMSLALGINDAFGFIGVGGYWRDGNNDGRIDERDVPFVNTSAVGIALQDLDLGFIIARELIISTTRVSIGVYLAAKIRLEKLSLVGIPGVILEAKNMQIDLNLGFRVSLQFGQIIKDEATGATSYQPGFKPSFGAIHRGGMKVMSESHDTIGVMARSVADCALSMGAMTVRDYGNPEAKLPRAPRLAFTLGPPAAKAAPETLALMERAIAACRKAGAEVVEITLPEVMTEAFDAHEYVTNMESVQSLGWELAAARAQLSDTIKEKLDWAKRFPTAQLDSCKATQAKARAALPGAIEGFDAVITASAAGEAPAGIGWTGDPAFNALWTLLHGPCVTVPAGTGPQGLPLGVQIAGRIGEDAKVLAIGEWLRGAL